jgi:predicted AlkP superfamily pyrophosphatase or phosphodiesterase
VLSSLSGGSITTVAPSTTVTALTSITTGLTPGEHGLIGYRIDMGDHVVQMLRWGDERGDLRNVYPPGIVQPVPPFLGAAVPVLSKAELEGSAFTEAHLRGTKPMGWRAASSLPVTIGSLLEEGARFVYAYYDGVDKIAHERGFGAYYEAELRTADRLVADIIDVLPTDAVLLVTADHGQVMVGDATITPDASLMRMVSHQSGEGRFRWLHLRQGSTMDALSLATELYGDVAWVLERERMIEEGWFGPRVNEVFRRRMGDIALVPFADVSFNDPLDSGPFVLQCRHGSVTAEEMDVPLLAYRSGN